MHLPALPPIAIGEDDGTGSEPAIEENLSTLKLYDFNEHGSSFAKGRATNHYTRRDAAATEDPNALRRREEEIFAAGAGGFVCGKSRGLPERSVIRDTSRFRNYLNRIWFTSHLQSRRTNNDFFWQERARTASNLTWMGLGEA